MPVAVQSVGRRPVAVRGEAGRRVDVAPECEMFAPVKLADPRGGPIEVIQEGVDGVGAKRHANDADEHGGAT